MAPELLENDEDVTENALELIKGTLIRQYYLQTFFSRVLEHVLMKHIDLKDSSGSRL